MTYLVKSNMSGETLDEFGSFDRAKEYADEGGFLRTCVDGKNTIEYPRRYVEDKDNIVAGATISGKSIPTPKVVYANYNWPKLSEAGLDEALVERQKALDQQEGWLNDFVYSTARKQ